MKPNYYLISFLALILLSSSCVSSKKFNQTVKERNYLDSLNLVGNNTNAFLKSKVRNLEKDTANCNSEVRDLIGRFNELSSNSTEREKMLADQVNTLQVELEGYQLQVHDKELKVKELQANIDRMDSISNSILQRVQEALNQFSENELTVYRKGGRVYVSLSEQLLFRSGSSTVNRKGKEALSKLAQVLNTDSEIEILIEGHTDSIPINTSRFKDNWDLSVLRSTSVIRILVKDYKVSGSRISAAGKAEFLPLANNKSREGREMNRRTEIILTPKLDILYDILEGKN